MVLAWVGVSGVWLLAATDAAAPRISVRGDSRCPSAAEVTSALAGMLPAVEAPAAAPTPPDVVELSGHHSASVNVRLTTADHKLIAEKRLPDTLSCGERARAAAVIVAAWEARFALPAPPPPPSTPPLRAASPIAPPAFAAATPPTTPPTPPPWPPASAGRGTGADLIAGAGAPRGAGIAASPPIQVEIGAAVLASLVGGALSPGLTVEARVFRAGRQRALGLAALAVGTHGVDVGAGQGNWRRVGGVIDGRVGAGGRTLGLEMRAGVALTALAITGGALPVTSGATVFDPGGLVALRARFRLATLCPWMEAAAVYWLRPHSLYVRGTALSSDMPAFEALLSAGVSFGSDR